MGRKALPTLPDPLFQNQTSLTPWVLDPFGSQTPLVLSGGFFDYNYQYGIARPDPDLFGSALRVMGSTQISEAPKPQYVFTKKRPVLFSEKPPIPINPRTFENRNLIVFFPSILSIKKILSFMPKIL